MTKNDIIRKLSSRKLWMALALFVSGLIVAFGGEADTGKTVAGCIMQAGAVVSYLFTEGWADAKHTEAVLDLTGVAVEEVEVENDGV